MAERLFTTNPRPMEAPAPLERTEPLKLIWHSLPAGLFLFALALLGAIAIAAFSASSSAPAEAQSVSAVELGADAGSVR